MRRIFPLGALAAFILPLSGAAVAANAADAKAFRVLRAEAITARAIDLPSDAANVPARLAFQAYGRQFDFALQSNARLLAGLPAAQKGSFERYPVYRGVVEGRPTSWVRLTRIGEELHGAFWDGSDLYTIAPARDVAPFALQSLDANGSDPVVYRLADTESVLDHAFCATGPEQGLDVTQKTPGSQTQYDALVSELQAVAAAVATEQIEIAFIADFEYTSRFPQDTQGTMLARVNVIDGIFDGQVGVAIVPSFQIFTENNDPFTTTVASDLLDQVGNYRRNTPNIRARGLAHLMTGRDLDGTTAGVAFVGSLCQVFAGAGLSENRNSVTVSALIAAHEIGHNFGAPHDAEPGSACESTPATFLMAPQINGNSTFSQCSLNQIRPNVAAAACVAAIPDGDAALALPGGTISAGNGIAFNVAVDVNSPGTAQVNGVVVTATPSATLSVDSASATNGTCTTGANGVVSCDLGSIASAGTKRITLGLRGNAAGAATVNVSLTASNDSNAQNNTGAQAISITAAPPPPPPPAPVDSDDGGGGALSIWMLGMLLALRYVTLRR